LMPSIAVCLWLYSRRLRDSPWSLRIRAGEIAKLTWEMVLDPNGAIATAIELRDWAAKKGSGRLIPVHPELREALMAWQDLSGSVGSVVSSERGGPMTPVSIVNWFANAYGAIGATGCSSHSGHPTVAVRIVAQTFCTKIAFFESRHLISIRDVYSAISEKHFYVIYVVRIHLFHSLVSC
jgi:integrase